MAAFDRRTFLRLTAAGLVMGGLAGLEGCSEPQPAEKIVPYVDSPEGVVPGIPRYYATALPTGGWVGGYGRGVIVTQHEGRPTKIEGNPGHPSSLGGTDIFMQAAVLQMYDPDRSTTPRRGHQALTWEGILGELRTFLAGRRGVGDPRVRLLTGTLTSPALLAQIHQLHEVFPGFRWHVHDVLGRPNARAGQRQALGRAVMPVLDLTRARRIVSLDAHFLAEETGGTGGAVRHAREWAFGRRLLFQRFGPNRTHREQPSPPPQTERAPDADQMTRLYVAESALTFTGAVADHRLAARPGMIARLAGALARSVRGQGDTGDWPADARAWLRAAAADLRAAGPGSLVLVGEYQPPAVHALACAMNAQLGAVGSTVTYHEPIEGQPEGDLADLAQAMSAGEVDLLVILETNPAFTSPSEIAFAEALAAFTRDPQRLTLHVGGYFDETAQLCRMHVPLSHPLEAWGDVRGHDGTTSIIQPLIMPLWSSKSAVEVCSALLALGMESGAATKAAPVSMSDLYADGYELLQRYWMGQWKDLAADDREARWRQSLRDGLITGTASPEVRVSAPADHEVEVPASPSAGALDIVFRPDPTLGDGAWANHPWLQELPKPLTHLTWDTVALVGPETARSLGITDPVHEARDTVAGLRVTVEGRSIEVPAWVQPGQAEGVIVLYLGGGRRSAGRVQDKVGVDVYPLRRSGALWAAAVGGLRVDKSARRYALACTQPQQNTDGRDLVRARNIADMPRDASRSGAPNLYATRIGPDGRAVHLSLYDERRYPGYKWGMVVDLSACIGCGACIVACQAENNSPSVGKDQVRRGREMHWIRIDTYYEPSAAEGPRNVQVHFLPMMCQHCQDAPCELVCPVEATSHSAEGINEMTYNRCIGTRYCSNNCPYKVRRFNFLQFTESDVLTWNMQKNPNVTVRTRGVMEKCTYCIQRINRARIDGKRAWARQDTSHGPPVEMREPAPDPWVRVESLPRLRFQTACQQACPTAALIFGDLNDAGALASVLKSAQPWASINYGLMTELNTEPRTSYLERLRNPPPTAPASAAGGGP